MADADGVPVAAALGTLNGTFPITAGRAPGTFTVAYDRAAPEQPYDTTRTFIRYLSTT